MIDFSGKYKLASSENFDDYMKALGIGFVLRKIANNAPLTVEIDQNGDEFVIRMLSVKTAEIKFKLGIEFEEVTLDGRKLQTIVVSEGNKLVQTERKSKDSVITRELVDGDLKMISIISGTIADLSGTAICDLNPACIGYWSGLDVKAGDNTVPSR